MDSAWLTLLAMNRTIWARELDLPVLFLGSLTALCATALVVGRPRAGRRFSLLAGSRHVLLTLVFQSPVVAAMACAVLLSGSLRSDDILAAQGGWPWQWFAFASPVALGIFVLLVLGLVPVRLACSGRAASGGQRRQRQLLSSAEHDAAGVESLDLDQRRHLPGVSWAARACPVCAAGDPAAGIWLQVAGALLFQAKAVLVLSSVLLLRFATNRVRISEVAQLGVRYLLPGAVLLLVASYFWAFGSQRARCFWPPACRSATACFSCVRYVRRMSYFGLPVQLGGERPRSAVNPWL